MSSLPGNDSRRFGFSTAGGVFLALVSLIGALWFSRSYYSNSGNVGWGDPSADKNQSIFWWGTVISLAVLLLMVIVVAIRSERFRFAVMGAGTFSGMLMFVSQKPDLRYASWPLLPGMFATMMSFGVHADFQRWASLLWVFSTNTLLYAAMISGGLKLLNRRKPTASKARG